MKRLSFLPQADIRRQATHWFVRVRSAAMTSLEEDMLTGWLDASPAHGEAFLRTSELWDAAEELRLDPQIAAMRQQALSRNPEPAPKSRRVSMAATFSVAGGLVAAAVGVLLIVQNLQPRVQVFRTGIGQTASIVLVDGSRVTLDTDTSVRTRIGGRRRQIYLDRGRAFFKVAKDHSRPFVVEADGKAVLATGTAFEVTAEPHRFEVLLVEGKVKVSALSGKIGYPAGSALSTDLKAGSRLSDTGSGSWILTREEDPNELAWMEGRLVFDNKPLGEIVAQMNRYSRRKIVIADPSVATRPIYGAFMAGDVDQFVRALIDYRVVRIKTQSEEMVVLSKP